MLNLCEQKPSQGTLEFSEPSETPAVWCFRRKSFLPGLPLGTGVEGKRHY
jgi:hypothetical protein